MGTGADARRPPAVTEPTDPGLARGGHSSRPPRRRRRLVPSCDTAPRGAARRCADARAVRARTSRDELERLEAAARAAVDVKAKVKRNPGKAAGAAAGIGFLALGGPRKVFRRAAARSSASPIRCPSAMLPDEIEKALRALGPDGAKVRGAARARLRGLPRAGRPARRNRRSTAIFLLLPTGARPHPSLRPPVHRGGCCRRGAASSEQLEKVRAREAEATHGRADRPAPWSRPSSASRRA